MRRLGKFCILEFRGKVNSRTQCVCIFPSSPPPPASSSTHTTDTACTHACHSRPRRWWWRQGFDGVHPDGLALWPRLDIVSPPPSAAPSSRNKRRRKRASRPDQSRRRLYIAVEGRESPYSQLSPPPPPPPLGVSLAAGGGVLSHLSMAACQHILPVERDGKEDSRIGNVTRASSFPPRVCFNLSTGRSKGGWGA